MRSCSLPVLVHETTEQVMSVHPSPAAPTRIEIAFADQSVNAEPATGIPRRLDEETTAQQAR